MDLYAPEPFADAGIALKFLQPRPPAYRQFDEAFHPYLSIADVMAFCDGAALSEQLAAYDVVPAADARARRRA